MNIRSEDDVLDPDRYSVFDLRALVFEGGQPLSRPLALTLLGLKDYQDKAQDFSRILADDREDPRMRIVAAQVLGKLNTPEAELQLRRASSSTNPSVLRGVVGALSRTRSESALSVLEELTSRRDFLAPLASEMTEVTEILASRLRRPDEATRRSGTLGVLKVDPARATSIDTLSVPTQLVRRAIRDVTDAVPGLHLTERGAVLIRCQGNTMILLFSDWTEEDAFATLPAFRSEIGVVASLEELETASWQVRYHILTYPADPGLVSITVVMSNGRRVLAGVGKLQDRQIAFQLGTVADAREVAIELSGTYDDGAVRFRTARCDTRRRNAPEPLPG